MIRAYEDEYTTTPIRGTMALRTRSIVFEDYSSDYIVSSPLQIKDMLLIFTDEDGRQYEFPVVPRDGKWLAMRKESES